MKAKGPDTIVRKTDKSRKPGELLLMKNKVKTWLKEGKVDLFLGYKKVAGHPLPYVFGKDKFEEIDELIEGPVRYPLDKLATKIVAAHPDLKIGLLACGSNQRALNVLVIWNQLEAKNMKTIPIDCGPSDSAKQEDGIISEKEETGPYKREVGVDNQMMFEEFERFDSQERLSRWMYEFQKCIKCYGCRNICPVCFCKECSLEHKKLIRTGTLPPEVPIFHLVRAVHMAGRCIDCGLCEEACPANIPLRLLYRKVNAIVKSLFDYENGVSETQSPFSVLGDRVTLTPTPMYTPKASDT